MMQRIFNYRGYTGSVEYSPEDQCYYGSIQNIRDLVSYEAATVDDLEMEFVKAVEDYLEICRELDRP